MEEMIFNLADTHLFFNDLEVSFCGSVLLCGSVVYVQMSSIHIEMILLSAEA